MKLERLEELRVCVTEPGAGMPLAAHELLREVDRLRRALGKRAGIQCELERQAPGTATCRPSFERFARHRGATQEQIERELHLCWPCWLREALGTVQR